MTELLPFQRYAWGIVWHRRACLGAVHRFLRLPYANPN